MTEENNKLRALVLSALMVVSVFGGTLALAGTAAAANNASIGLNGQTTEGQTTTYTTSADVQLSSGQDVQYVEVDLGDADVSSVQASDITISASGSNTWSQSGSALEVNQNDSGVVQFTITSSQNLNDGNTVTIDIANVKNPSGGDYTADVSLYNTSGFSSAPFDTWSADYSTTFQATSTISAGDVVFQGQTAKFSGLSNGNTATLRKNTSSGSTYVTEFDIDSNDQVSFDTDDYEGRYFVTDGNNEIPFEVVKQSFTTTMDPSTVNNEGSSSAVESTLTISSNRKGTYNAFVLSSNLSDDDLTDVIPGAVDVDIDGDAEDDDDGVYVSGIGRDAANEPTLNFTGIDAGNYDLTFLVADTTASSSASITVEAVAEGDVSFNKSVYSEEQGDVASIVVDMTGGADESTITVGSDGVSYVANTTIEDVDGDGQVTLLWNTSNAKTGAGTVFEAAGEDTATAEDLKGSAFKGNSRLGPTEYELSAEFGGSEADVGVVSLTRPSQVQRSAAAWTASGSIDLADLDISEDATQDSDVATGDYVILQFKTAGIYGTVFNADQLNATTGTDGVYVSINETEASTGVNQDPKSELAGNFTLVRDAANNQFFLVAKQGEDLANVASGDEFNATLTIDKSNPYVSETQMVSTEFSITEQTATVNGGSPVEVESSENGTISGTSSLSSGSKITVRLRNSGGDNPFLRQNTVTVGANGDWSTTFDLSDIPQGTNFTINVLAGSTSLLDDKEPVAATMVAPATASLSLASLDAPQTASPGETITVTATVENTGSASGSADVSFVFEGETVDTQSVTVDAGSTSQVTFEATVPSETGTYTHGVMVGDNAMQNATITVEEDPTSTAPTSTAPTSTAPTSTAPTSTAPTSTAPTSTAPTSTAPTSTAPTDDPTTSEMDDGETSEETDAPTTTESSGQPGFGVAIALVALVAAALLAVRRDN